MNNTLSQPDDAKLSQLLREARPAPPLPPGFQNAVWRRLEKAEPPQEPFSLAGWLDRCAAWLLRPRLAAAGLAVLLLVGALVGVMDGVSLSKQAAQQRYLASVSPMSHTP